MPPPARDCFQQDVAWSLDGSYIAFSEYVSHSPAAKYDPKRWAIKIMPADGSKQPRTLVENAQWVTWTSTGDGVVFSAPIPGGAGADSTDYEIYSANLLESKHRRRLTRDPARDTQPSCSPRGDGIVFVSDRGGEGNTDLYFMDEDGQGVRRLTTDPAKEQCPAWSPDGSTIVFFREVPGGQDQIFTIAADGSNETRITNDESLNTFPSFVPVAAARRTETLFSILFTCQPKDQPERLVILSRTGPPTPGDSVRQDVLRGVPAFFARTSPDGRSLAIIVGRWPKSAIYIADPRDPPRFRKLVN